MKRFSIKLSAFLLIVLIGQIVVSLEYRFEPGKTGLEKWMPSISIPNPDLYDADPEIMAIQQHLVAHPTLGFLWKSNIDPADAVVVQWGDIPADALSTDEFGFINTPEAIASRREGRPVDIIGVGASYMAGAQGLFRDYFEIKGGYSYYNMANSRYTIPHFNVALKEFALPLKPRWIIYGLNEVSFLMIDDFEGWQKSGMDWFSYHRGCWAGPPLKTGFPHNQLRSISQSAHGIYASVERRLFRASMINLTEAQKRHLVDRTVEYVLDAYKAVQEQGVGFILLLIPSKDRMVSGPTSSHFLFERSVPRFEEAGIPILDMREDFAKVDDPSALYFAIDNHWNRQGIYLAAKAVMAAVQGERR